MTERTVCPSEVSAVLAELRPPACREVTLRVMPRDDADSTPLESVLQSILTEVVTGWPAGTTWIVEFARGYLQGITYTPTCLIEFGPPPASPELWDYAKQAGWLDPHSVPRGHSDFKSRPVWGDNPVQEVDVAYAGIPKAVAVLADAADSLLMTPRGVSMAIEIFCNVPDDGGDEVVEASADLPDTINVTSMAAQPSSIKHEV